MINLKKGWNFISFTINDLSKIISNENITEIKDLEFSWNRTIPSFFNTLKTIELNQGYIVQCTNDTILSLDYNNINEITYNLKKGWNLIGWQKDVKLTELVLPTNLIEIKSTNKSYNKNIPSFFNTLDVFNIGTAYWVKMEESYEWNIIFEKSDLTISSTFDPNFREFNIKIDFGKKIEESILSIENITNNNFILLPGQYNRDLRIEDDNIIIPKMENDSSIEFILRGYNLTPGKYNLELDNQKINLDLPEIPTFDYTNSNYFENNNKPKLLMICFAGADNNLEKYYFVDMKEHANMINKNKDNYDICFVTLVDRSDYNDPLQDDLNDWFENDTFNVTIKDKSLGIYICNNKTNYKWDEFKIGNYQNILQKIKNDYDNISTNKNVFDLFLNLVLDNLKDNEKNNPNIAISIDIWNHGVYYGINVDPKTIDKMIYMNEIHDIIKNNLDKHMITKLDYLIFDCCLTASLSNVLLFSSITNYLLSSSTVQPGDGYNFNFYFNPELNIKNEFLDQLYDETIKSYRRYWETLSVFDMKRFQYFEDNMKELLNKINNIIELRSDFNSIEYIERDFKDIKPLFVFLEKYKDYFDDFNFLKNAYNKILNRTSNQKYAIAITQNKLQYEGKYFDTTNNLNYFYDFFSRQPGKPEISIQFGKMLNVNNIIIITIDIVGQLKEDILLRFSNGFSYVNSFEILSSTTQSDIFTSGFKKFLRISKVNKSTINLSVKSNSNIEIIYFNGEKFYLDDSPYQVFNNLKNNNDTKNISSLASQIPNLSYSLELTKLNLQNIIGNEDDIISNIELLEVNDKVNISGFAKLDDTVNIDYGFTELKNLFENINKNKNNELIIKDFNLDIDVKQLLINKIEFTILDYKDTDEFTKVITIIVYQNKPKPDNFGPFSYSRILNLELTFYKQDSKLEKRLWDVYTNKNIKSEVIPNNESVIYPISLQIFKNMNDINTININNFNYQFKFMYNELKNEYYKTIFKDIKSFNFKNKDTHDSISLYFRIKDELITRNFNFIPLNTTTLNQDNFIDKINSDFGIQNVLFNPLFYLDDWNTLDESYKNNLIKLGFTESVWKIKQFDIDFPFDNNDFPILKLNWLQLSDDIKNVVKELGYNSYSWRYKELKFKKSYFINSDIFITGQKVFIQDSLVVNSSSNILTIGLDSTLMINKSILLNYGTIIIQDNGILTNNFIINNMNNGKIIITSLNENNKPDLTTNNLLLNSGKIIITGYGSLTNKYVLRNNNEIILTSSNKNAQIESKATLYNLGYILPASKLDFYDTKLIVEYGSLVSNDGLIQVGNIFVNNYLENGLNYISKIFDFSTKSISPFVLKDIDDQYMITNLFMNDQKNQVFFTNSIPINSDDNILLSTVIKVIELPYYYDFNRPNLKGKIAETDKYLQFTIKNDSNYDSFGFNNNDYIRIGIQDNTVSIPSSLSNLVTNVLPELQKFIKVVDDKYKIKYEGQNILISPSIKSNDNCIIEIDKKEFVKQVQLVNKVFKIQLIIDINNYVKETNERDNLIEKTFRISL